MSTRAHHLLLSARQAETWLLGRVHELLVWHEVIQESQPPFGVASLLGELVSLTVCAQQLVAMMRLDVWQCLGPPTDMHEDFIVLCDGIAVRLDRLQSTISREWPAREPPFVVAMVSENLWFAANHLHSIAALAVLRGASDELARLRELSGRAPPSLDMLRLPYT